MAQGALTAAAAGEEVVSASDYCALEVHVCELHRLLGKRLWRTAPRGVSRRQGLKNTVALNLVAAEWPVSAVAEAVGIARPHLSAMRHCPAPRPRGRRPLLDADLVASTRAILADLPTYGYRPGHALLRRHAKKIGRETPNPKHVYCVMKVHGLLLQ